jgi:hypothetical protein
MIFTLIIDNLVLQVKCYNKQPLKCLSDKKEYECVLPDQLILVLKLEVFYIFQGGYCRGIKKLPGSVAFQPVLLQSAKKAMT